LANDGLIISKQYCPNKKSLKPGKSLKSKKIFYYFKNSLLLRLETALIANQERLKLREARQRQAAETEAKVSQQVPSIKLTMDFASKFAAK